MQTYLTLSGWRPRQEIYFITNKRNASLMSTRKSTKPQERVGRALREVDIMIGGNVHAHIDTVSY